MSSKHQKTLELTSPLHSPKLNIRLEGRVLELVPGHIQMHVSQKSVLELEKMMGKGELEPETQTNVNMAAIKPHIDRETYVREQAYLCFERRCKGGIIGGNADLDWFYAEAIYDNQHNPECNSSI